MKKRIASLALALALSLSLCATSVCAAPGQEMYEQAYFWELVPDEAGFHAEYPATLILQMSGKRYSFEGYCGRHASLTDDEKMAALNQGLDAVEGYQSLKDAYQDKMSVSDLTDKLKLKQDISGDLLNFALRVTEFDSFLSIFNKLSPIDILDMESALSGNVIDGIQFAEGAKGLYDKLVLFKKIYEGIDEIGDFDEFIKPELIPSVHTVILNTTKISWEEYKKDQEKYKNIVALSQAKGRLRDYYIRVHEVLQDVVARKGSWKVTMNVDTVVDTPYDAYGGQDMVPTRFNVYMDLTKRTGQIDEITGTYIGPFTLEMESMLREYDNNRAVRYAELLNSELEAGTLQIAALTGHMEGRSFRIVDDYVNIKTPSQSRIKFRCEDLEVKLTLPQNKLRAFWEIPLDTSPLEQVEYVSSCDYEMQVSALGLPPNRTWIQTYGEKNDTGSFSQWDHTVITLPVAPYKVETHNNDSGALPTDFRPYIKLTLTVDMLD